MATRIQRQRRRSLVEAAYATVLEDGLEGMTMARVSRRAGLSPGIVNYHFRDKDTLVIWVVRHALRLILEDAVRRLQAATTPRERISAVIAANFSERAFDRQTAASWVSFYAAVASNPEVARLQELVYRRQRSNLVPALCALTTRARAATIAHGISVMIDGLWMQRAMSSQEVSREQAIALIEEHVTAALAGT